MAPKLPVSSSRPFRIFALPLARLPPPSSSRPANPSTSSSSSSITAAAAPPTSPLESVPESVLKRHPSSSSSASASTSASSSDTTASSGSAKTPLLLFHTSQPDPTEATGNKSQQLASKALAKASDTWLKLGQKPKDSWTYWFYAKGEKLMDRIEYEEWALKAVKENEGVKVDKDGKIVSDRIEIPLLRPALSDTTLPPLLPKLHRLLIHRIPYHRKMMWRSLIFTPVTWPFAIIPVIPNFPFFYVLWRAWSHYKAWRGALYLEILLKNGLIVEKEDKQLSEIYAKKAVSLLEEGAENHAPDETTSRAEDGSSVKLGSLATSSDSQQQPSVVDGSKELNAQAKGETVGSADGTATPSSMVHQPSSSPASASATSSSSSSEKTSSAKTGTIEQPYPSPAPGPITSKAHHKSLLLSPSHIPLLAKTFNLRPNEVVDITRALEQADFRARKSDKEKAEKQATEQEQQQQQQHAVGKAEGHGKGTEWRGNLHR
ncbi:hypothetical protein I317_02094 [Kwoniella heveanensis CBS 569]|uniref:Mitochondrial K+-H+ exchange-related-domain-containing protein n=1 Tax=Kwoniella heveanensis BCC8398 TaxID=1296120 RepID=A0A1B9GNT2_9TREE|nr:hypothetical protein I316_05651 [Kwoniella heveanensis BCC8398]OCF43988.1 hypothetical protein I317_02094 [Kwoniella heveanensis CBS 569]